MKIKTYFKEIKDKINKLNGYITNPINYNNIENPFAKAQTYVWLEREHKQK